MFPSLGRHRRRIRAAAACLAIVLGLALRIVLAQEGAGPAATEDGLPPPLTHYMGREIAPTMTYHGAAWLTRKERDGEEDTKLLFEALHLKLGQSVCDLGCGNGFYTLRMAKRVGDKGTIYGVDIQPEMLHLLELRAKDVGLKNIKPVLCNRVDPRLPPGQLDLVLLVDVYHELANPEEVLHAIRASLKPHGRLVLAEFRMEDPAVPIKLLHKMSKDQIRKEILPAGYRLVEQFDELPWQHLMFFEPSENSDPAPAEAAPSTGR